MHGREDGVLAELASVDLEWRPLLGVRRKATSVVGSCSWPRKYQRAGYIEPTGLPLRMTSIVAVTICF